MSTIPEVFVCRFSPCVTDHSVLTDMFRNTQTYDPDQFHPSSNCSSSSMLCTSFTAARSCAECGYPAVYHATCFRISRIAVSSLLYFICRPAWRRIISFTSESSGFFGTVLCSRYSAVCAKIHGFPCAARPIITPSHPVSSRSAFAFCGESTSPFPITGMDTASFTFRMISQSAFPE